MKEYYVKHSNSNRSYYTVWRGTLEHLLNDVFGYTIECGHSWDNSINAHPKTGKGLVSALNKSCTATNRYYDYYELITKEEYNNLPGTEDFSNSKTIRE